MPQTQVRLFRDAQGNVPVQTWLAELRRTVPRAHAKCLQRILMLSQFGNELRRPHADMLRDGIYELRARLGSVNYRMLYFFSGRQIAIVSHGLTKETAVPDAEIERAVQRRGLVLSNPQKHTADFTSP